MKPTFALLSILLILGLGACSTSADNGSKKATLTSCTPGDPGKPVVLLNNSYAPEGRVVRLAH